MKKIFLVFTFSLISFVYAQAQESVAEKLAYHIAEKMKDSLGLIQEQADRIYGINMNLHNQKMLVRNQLQDKGIIGKILQQIENARDIFYSDVLNEEQFAWYLEKKSNLIRIASISNK